jgi:hypothetical protein
VTVNLAKRLGISRIAIWKLTRRYPWLDAWCDEVLRESNAHYWCAVARKMALIAMQGSAAHADQYCKMRANTYAKPVEGAGILEDPLVQATLLAQAQRGTLPPAVMSLLFHCAYGKPKETVALEARPDPTRLMNRRATCAGGRCASAVSARVGHSRDCHRGTVKGTRERDRRSSQEMLKARGAPVAPVNQLTDTSRAERNADATKSTATTRLPPATYHHQSRV